MIAGCESATDEKIKCERGEEKRIYENRVDEEPCESSEEPPFFFSKSRGGEIYEENYENPES